MGSVYRPPNSDGRSFIGYLEHALATIQHERFETIVLGDFNLDVKSRDKTAITKDFLYTMQFYDLHQLIREATRISNHSRSQIDLFFTSRPELYISGVKQVDFSDHNAIFGVRKLHRFKLPPPRIIEARNYRTFDSNLFKSDLEHVQWELLELEADVEEAWIFFEDLFNSIADAHVPMVKRRVRGKSLPWISSSIRDLMKQREFYHRKAIKTNKEIYWSTYKRLRNAVTLCWMQ